MIVLVLLMSKTLLPDALKAFIKTLTDVQVEEMMDFLDTNEYDPAQVILDAIEENDVTAGMIE